jgi:hypothetical protein
MNIVQIQNDLKDLSDRQLLDSMNMGSAPQYLVLSEMQRRQKMRSESGAMKAPQSSVAEDVMGGIASMPAPNMQRASGGVVGFAGGGQPSAYAKGAAEACWTNPETGKQDCPPATSRLMGGKKPKTKTKKTEDSGIKSLYAPGGMVRADSEEGQRRLAELSAQLEEEKRKGRLADPEEHANVMAQLQAIEDSPENQAFMADAPARMAEIERRSKQPEQPAPEPNKVDLFEEDPKEQGIKGAYKDKKGKESNRFADWMLETGLGMLASKNRNFFGALGESGLGAYKNITARDAEAAKAAAEQQAAMDRQIVAAEASKYGADLGFKGKTIDSIRDEATALRKVLLEGIAMDEQQKKAVMERIRLLDAQAAQLAKLLNVDVDSLQKNAR